MASFAPVAGPRCLLPRPMGHSTHLQARPDSARSSRTPRRRVCCGGCGLVHAGRDEGRSERRGGYPTRGTDDRIGVAVEQCVHRRSSAELNVVADNPRTQRDRIAWERMLDRSEIRDDVGSGEWCELPDRQSPPPPYPKAHQCPSAQATPDGIGRYAQQPGCRGDLDPFVGRESDRCDLCRELAERNFRCRRRRAPQRLVEFGIACLNRLQESSLRGRGRKPTGDVDRDVVLPVMLSRH